MEALIGIINSMKDSRVGNYAIAGLDSYLLGNGLVRYFECSRDHQDAITPHSHRFNFSCLVLEGTVRNRLWVECSENNGDFFESSALIYEGSIGEHRKEREGRGYWKYTDTVYAAGDTYAMSAHEVHSIYFSRGAKVLFLEGPDITNRSLIIEPVVDGEVIQTYRTLDYMFRRYPATPPDQPAEGES